MGKINKLINNTGLAAWMRLAIYVIVTMIAIGSIYGSTNGQIQANTKQIEKCTAKYEKTLETLTDINTRLAIIQGIVSEMRREDSLRNNKDGSRISEQPANVGFAGALTKAKLIRSSTMATRHITIPKLSYQDKRRFWAKVFIGDKDDCWLWRGGTTDVGYGRFWASGRMYGSNRIAYAIKHGHLPTHLCVCHTCDNPLCCNPDHLWVGTLTDNNRDAVKKGRAATGERNGSHTHPERVARGDRHGSRTHPERIAKGKRSGSYLHPETHRGEKNGGAKLTSEEVVEIRARCADNSISQKKIADIYGVTPACISSIKLRKLWAHI